MSVYFLRAGDNGPVKIGFSIALVKRIRVLQVAHYERLLIVRLVEGGQCLERRLHDKFDHLRIRGEWYTFHRGMIEFAAVGLSFDEINSELMLFTGTNRSPYRDRIAPVHRTAEHDDAYYGALKSVNGDIIELAIRCSVPRFIIERWKYRPLSYSAIEKLQSVSGVLHNQEGLACP